MDKVHLVVMEDLEVLMEQQGITNRQGKVVLKQKHRVVVVKVVRKYLVVMVEMEEV